MIEQERRNAHGDSAIETERWLGQLSEASRKHIRYQEMGAEELIDFEELKTRLSALEKLRNTAERELHALLRHHTERLVRPERDRDSLLES
jgi:hypothetical protein